MENSTFDHTTDVLVIGSGAGALTAAIRAHDEGSSVLVIEKTDMFGGTSAMSGGVLWLPNSPLITDAGGQDSEKEAKGYMQSVINEPALAEKIDAYVDSIPPFIDFMHANTHLRFNVLPNFPDMYPDNPDFKMHRCHESQPFDAKVLGTEELLKLRAQHPQTALWGLIGWTCTESLILQARGKGWLQVAASMVMRYVLDLPWRFKSKRDRRLVLGGALIGALRLSMLDRKIPLWLSTAADELLIEDGRVIGISAHKDGQTIRIRANKAVILASGGFEKNNTMRQRYLAKPTDAAWTAGSPGNTGEMIEAGEKLGAKLGFMDEGWWGPTITLPGEPQARMLIIEKNLPGSILVNKVGERFVNESSSYTKVYRGIMEANQPGKETVPAYLIFDVNYRARYPFGPMLPKTFQPDWAVSNVAKQEIKKAGSIRELAEKLGIDPANLEQTVGKMNDYARTGKDLDFQRGDATYDQYYGDQDVKPNCCLGPIDSAPYYGVKVYPGELGTKGGLMTDAQARVQSESGGTIPGLYAIGNCSASVMGTTYPASGATLGPAMVFGYVAGAAAAQEEKQKASDPDEPLSTASTSA
ncbi:MAG: FAD-binding protein [Pseudomonadales bacterium]